MTTQEISAFLEPHERVLRAIRKGAGDKEILEAKKSIGAVVVRFNHPSIQALARTAFIHLDRALKYVDYRKKNESATTGAEYFADRAFKAIWDIEKADSEN